MTKFSNAYNVLCPTNIGALPRWLFVITNKHPENGWAVTSYCYGRTHTFEFYWPTGLEEPYYMYTVQIEPNQ